MWVVKLGGSLGRDESLRHWLEAVARHGQGRVVIVPGGGGFADQVRAAQRIWGFSDGIAHRMALLAMQQFGWLLSGLAGGLPVAEGAAAVGECLRRRRDCIWLPDPEELNRAGVPASWEVTSDSLAAWLAGMAGASRLILVKSDPRTLKAYDWPELARVGVVDGKLMDFLPVQGVAECWHRSRYRAFGRRLRETGD